MEGFALGLVFLGGGIGGILGPLTSAGIAAGLGVGPAIVVSTVIGAAAMYGYLLATPATGVVVLVGVFLGTGFTVLLYNINQVSLRQGLVPVRLQGRLNATMRFLVWGTMPLGGLLGGVLGTVLGVRDAIAVAVIGLSFAFLWVLLSPVRAIQTMPEPAA